MKDIRFFTEQPPLPIVYGIFIGMAGFMLPVLLIPLVSLTGYSEVVEEVFKVLVVLFLILKLPTHKMQILAGIGFGLLFGVSENFLYLNQIFQLGDMNVFLQRFVWTVPMHIATTLIIVFSGIASKKFLVVGFVAAVILHALFNEIASSILVR
jgi:RsiW-degrading membrane proteinase PrsW (M82 family)